MQGLFWFFLGGFVYFVIDKTTSFFKKVKFINDVKIHSFKLIAFAFEQFVFTMTAKYIMLESNPDFDKEKIKLFKNNDEAVFQEWKKKTVVGLNNSVPPLYRAALEIENWDDVMDILDKHHKKQLHINRLIDTEQKNA